MERCSDLRLRIRFLANSQFFLLLQGHPLCNGHRGPSVQGRQDLLVGRCVRIRHVRHQAGGRQRAHRGRGGQEPGGGELLPSQGILTASDICKQGGSGSSLKHLVIKYRWYLMKSFFVVEKKRRTLLKKIHGACSNLQKKFLIKLNYYRDRR